MLTFFLQDPDDGVLPIIWLIFWATSSVQKAEIIHSAVNTEPVSVFHKEKAIVVCPTETPDLCQR